MRLLCCCCSSILMLISIAIIAFGVFLYIDFADLYNDRVKSQMIIDEESVLYDNWLKSQTIHTTKFYIFEVENPKEVLIGKKPKVKEVGPYVFDVHQMKEKITFSFDKTVVSYVERKVYKFDRFMSIGSIDENITVINIPIVALNPFMSQLAKSSNLINSRINSANASSIFEIFGSNVFVSKSVREILFDGNNRSEIEKISQLYQSIASLGIPEPKLLPKTFSLFRNNSENRYEVLTGIKTNMNARIIKFNNKPSLSVWTGRACNQINGTDGYQFPPLLQKQNRLNEFSADICRSIEMSYEMEDELLGIRFYRFSPVANVFYSLYNNTKNKCFCLSPKTPEKCNFDGILDLSSCYSEAPLILSNPHFRRASYVITQSVVGLSPEKELHQTFVDIEPTSGIVINKARRYQINVHVKKCPLMLNMDRYLKESIIPVVWFEDLSQIESNQMDYIKMLFVYPNKYQETVVLSTISFGSVMLLMSLCCCCCCGKSKKKIDPISSEANNVTENQKPNKGETPNESPKSHNYDEIFKGQTPLNRLKQKLPKRIKTQESSAAQPPPPPPPPPPLLSFQSNEIISEINEISATDSRQNLLNDIRLGTKLRKVDSSHKPIKSSITQKQLINSSDTSRNQNSFNNELQQQIINLTQNNDSFGGQQSYYRWSNTNHIKSIDKNSIDSTLNQRTRFQTPPIPLRRTSLNSSERLNTLNNKSIDKLESDFSEEEDTEENLNKLKKLIQNFEPIVTITKKSVSNVNNRCAKNTQSLNAENHIINKD